MLPNRLLRCFVICMGAGVLAPLSVCAVPQTPRGYDSYCETIARGLDAWVQSVGTVEGMCAARTYFSPAGIDEVKKTRAQTGGGSLTSSLTEHSLYMCRFFLGRDAWSAELAELVPCGMNPWGAWSGGDGKPLADVTDARDAVVWVRSSDGDTTTVYAPRASLAKIKNAEPSDRFADGSGHVMEAMLLEAADVALGRAFLDLIHGDYNPKATSFVRATKTGVGDAPEAWRLQAYFTSNSGDIIRYTVWVDPQRGYMPLAFESLIVNPQARERGMRHYRRVLSSKQVGDVYLPVETLYVWYVYGGLPTSWQRIEHVLFSDLRANLGKPTFSLLPPLGTLLHDDRPEVLRHYYLGDFDGALQEFRNAIRPEPDQTMDRPLTGHEMDEGFAQ